MVRFARRFPEYPVNDADELGKRVDAVHRVGDFDVLQVGADGVVMDEHAVPIVGVGNEACARIEPLIVLRCEDNGTVVGSFCNESSLHVQAGESTCLTKDHTRVGELVRMKVLSTNKVRTHNQRSVLSKCLGLELFVQPDVFEVQVQDDDKIIFCSDGVWSVIDDDEFGTLASKAVSAEQLNQTIIDLAMNRGSDDNVSAMTIMLHKLVPCGKRYTFTVFEDYKTVYRPSYRP